MGLGFNGGELLLLSIGGCCSNDIYREAAKRGMKIHNVTVKVTADWAGDPVRAQNVAFFAVVEADASEKDILDLIHHTDRVAEIPNSLRFGTEVTSRESTSITRTTSARKLDPETGT